MEIYFFELTKLHPSLASTIFKMNEEKGELSREILKFYPYMNANKDFVRKNAKVKKIFDHIIEELLDVGQTTATMLFVLEKNLRLNGLSLNQAIQNHLTKLTKKGYSYDSTGDFFIRQEVIDGKNIAKIVLPRLTIDTDMMRTCLKIDEEAGELVQFAGKKSGASGEIKIEDTDKINQGIIAELFDIAQCCVTMLYILVDKYDVDITTILKNHSNKLHSHGYC